MVATDVFHQSTYEQFPKPLTEHDIDRFNVFYCLNAPSWVPDSEICEEAAAARESLNVK